MHKLVSAAALLTAIINATVTSSVNYLINQAEQEAYNIYWKRYVRGTDHKEEYWSDYIDGINTAEGFDQYINDQWEYLCNCALQGSNDVQ